MSLFLRDTIKLIAIAILWLGIQFLVLNFLVPNLVENHATLFNVLLKITGMMFFVNFIAYALVSYVHKILPQKSLFVYFFAILLKMIFVIFLVMSIPAFKSHVLWVMLNYLIFLFLTIFFLKNRILGV